jgi:hypothetical protein
MSRALCAAVSGVTDVYPWETVHASVLLVESTLPGMLSRKTRPDGTDAKEKHNSLMASFLRVP